MAKIVLQHHEQQWQATPLTGEAWRFDEAESWRPVDANDEQANDEQAAILLMRAGSGRLERWLLLARRDQLVTVNGSPLKLGMRELHDRDEVLVAGGLRDAQDAPPRRLYFSTERLAWAEALPEGPRGVYCVRCKQLIPVGSPAVRCPGPTCGLWHHQSHELPCWEYAECCAACDQSTDRNAGFRWTPEDL